MRILIAVLPLVAVLPYAWASAIAISFALTWLRLVSGSLWPGAFLHASHNLFMQQIFTPLTSDTGWLWTYEAKNG